MEVIELLITDFIELVRCITTTGTSFYLIKLKKDGTESSSSNNYTTWPFNSTYTNNARYASEYYKHNGKNGENVKIDVVAIDPKLQEKASKKAEEPKNYQFTSNGIRNPEGKYTSVWYRLNDDGSVNVSSKDYGSDIRFLATATDKIQNDSDTMTDYFDKDSITVTASNPHYQAVKRAALKNELSSLKDRLKTAQEDVVKYGGNTNYYNGEYYLKNAKESVKKLPGQIAEYEKQLKALEKDMKKTVKKSMPMFIIKDGRFLVRK